MSIFSIYTLNKLDQLKFVSIYKRKRDKHEAPSSHKKKNTNFSHDLVITNNQYNMRQSDSLQNNYWCTS